MFESREGPQIPRKFTAVERRSNREISLHVHQKHVVPDCRPYWLRSCLQVFSRADLLQQHEPQCIVHPPQMVKYPDPEDPDKCIVKFRALKKQHRIPFYLVCDFECFLMPVDDDDNDDDDNVTATNVVDA